MYKIGEFSKISGLSIDTLYHYEKMKLLKPCRIDYFTGYRYYDVQQLIYANKILALKDANFSLEEIASILHSDITSTCLIEMLEQKAESLELNIRDENKKLERLQHSIFLIKNGGIPPIGDVIIKKVEPILIASIRNAFQKSHFNNTIPEMWKELNSCLKKKQVRVTTPCLMLYHSGWWDLEQLNIFSDEYNLDVEVAEPIMNEFVAEQNVQLNKLPQIERMASVIHCGPFDTIGKTTDRLFSWLKQNKYVVDGPIREIYHNGDWATDNPEEYVTELQVPIK